MDQPPGGPVNVCSKLGEAPPLALKAQRFSWAKLAGSIIHQRA
jgi:hypothetical protein